MRLIPQDISRVLRTVLFAGTLAGAMTLVGCDDSPDSPGEAVDRAADAAEDAIDKTNDAID